MRWLAAKAERAGAQIAYRIPFEEAERTQRGFILSGMGTTRYLVGADGPHSRVAKSLGLGQSRQFLQGMEYEFAGRQLDTPDRLHCFIDRKIAPGYLGWVVAGVGMVQVGLARRGQQHRASTAQAMGQFLEKIAPIFDVRRAQPTAIRGGLIPCGGVVNPVASSRVMLVGDAAGMVSPLTAGGIHTALKHGMAVGHAITVGKDGRSKRLVCQVLSQFCLETMAEILVRSLPIGRRI